MIGRSWAAGAFMVLACSASSHAQTTSFEWVPYGGLFVPTRDLGTATISGTDYAIRQETGAAFGARLVGWWSRVVGWEGNFAYSLSDVKLTSAGGTDACAGGTNCSSNVWFASSKLMFRYAPETYKGWYVFAGGGLAVAGHVGDFWDQADATTDLGGVVGIGGAIDLSKRFAIRIDAEDYFYKYEPQLEDDPESGTFAGCSKVQNDLVFSVGVIIRLAGM
jgi:hypothetical protein